MDTGLEDKTVRRSRKAAWRVFNDQAVLLDTCDSRMYGLNGTGAAVWTLIGDGIALPDLVERFAREHARPPGEVEDDVLQFIESLEARGLVEVS